MQLSLRLKPTPIAACLCLLGLFSLPVYADTPDNSANEAQLINTLTQRTAQLEQQILQLQTELNQLKAQPKTKPVVRKVKAKPKTATNNNTSSTNAVTANSNNPNLTQANGAVCPIPVSATTNTASNQNTSSTPQAENATPLREQPFGGSVTKPVPLCDLVTLEINLGGMPVITSPYLGQRSAFDASDLVSFLPNINEDLHLLQERQKIENVFEKYGEAPPDNPSVDISGEFAAIGMEQNPASGPHTSTIDLPTAELFALGNINTWTTAFMAIAYDNTSPSQQTPPTLGPTTANSRVFLDQGFISIGNLNRLPFYGTIGQMYVPFGQYNTAMITNPLTIDLGRTKERALLLGFDEPGTYNGLQAQIYTFKGSTGTSPNQSQINNVGGNLDYTINAPSWNTDIGASIISNLAESAGMQQTGASSGFAGFGGAAPATNAEVLEHQVPGLDLHGDLGIGSFSFIAEYVGATTSFSSQNMTFNNDAAKPQAQDFEGMYTFNMFNRPANFAIGYQQTEEP